MGIIYYYTDSKMGMKRHMMYLNMKYESIYNLRLVFIILLVALLIFTLIYWKKAYTRDKILILAIDICLFISIFFGERILNQSFHLVSLILSLEGILQVIKIIGSKKESYDYIV